MRDLDNAFDAWVHQRVHRWKKDLCSALSGYVTTQSGELLAFSMLVNHFRHGIQPVWRIQDALGELLSRVSDEPSQHAQAKTKPSGAQPQ